MATLGDGGQRKRAPRGSSANQAAVDAIWRGRTMLSLMRDLYLNEWSHRELAAQYNVSPTEIATFAAMNAGEIAEIGQAIAGKLAIDTAGLWISKRANRVAEIQGIVEQLVVDTAVARDRFGVGSKEHNNMVRTLLQALKAAGEEYIPTRRDRSDAEPAQKPERYILELPPGVMEALQ